MLDIFDTHWQTLLAYSMGVILVLTVGMQVMRFLDVTTDLLHQEEGVKDGIAIAYHRIFDGDDTDEGVDPPSGDLKDSLNSSSPVSIVADEHGASDEISDAVSDETLDEALDVAARDIPTAASVAKSDSETGMNKH
jgi:hypothetical protein